MTNRKVVLTGNFGVGKTSLFNRFINNTFSDKYLTTIGVKVNKKTVDVNGRQVNLLIWDIAGEVDQDKVPVSYFLGTSAILYVYDLTRPLTYARVMEDLQYLKKISPTTVIKLVGNKTDLVPKELLEQRLVEMEFQTDWLTSAKTGENVEELFLSIASSFI